MTADLQVGILFQEWKSQFFDAVATQYRARVEIGVENCKIEERNLIW